MRYHLAVTILRRLARLAALATFTRLYSALLGATRPNTQHPGLHCRACIQPVSSNGTPTFTRY